MVVGTGASIAASLFGAVVVAVLLLWAASEDNVDTAFSGCAWTAVLVGVVVGMIWAFGTWVGG